MGNIPLTHQSTSSWLVFLAAGFLVSVPVFIEAPLVRLFPEISVLMTGGWLWVSFYLMRQPKTQLWGDLLFGFSWSWLAGSVYWGWLRWEPLIHLPVESMGVPIALWCLWRGWGKIGNFFYLGSLLGTAITDIYFYITGLIPHWRQLMQVDPSLATPIFQAALAQVQTPWGLSWAVVLANALLGMGLWAMQQSDRHWWAFAGAVLSTILVDSLFWFAASFA
ncbi:DUF3120 domain-containing protein [Crocosphaera sp. XPORK-15E]|nr:DUF3120 domain-containing protein [Crocosphaera sp. XPORK-15E]MEA5535957.1 DUF3120 domain-containing protein [Crocosphaera sp. XPORK-15E]